MRTAIALAVVAAAAAQQPDARDVIRHSVEANERNWKIARNYTFLERIEERSLDSGGRVKSKEVKTYDVTLLEGSPYRRWIERDDRPLPPQDENKEREKLARSMAERSRETQSARERRIADYERRRERDREMMREVADAFDFRIAASDRIDGREVWVIDATPRSGFEPRSRDGKIFPHVRGKLWIDKQSLQWAKLDAEVIDAVSWGLFLVRLDRGAHLSFEQTRVNDEVWLPRHALVTASARLGIIKKMHVQQDVTYKNFRKFQTDARLVSAQ